MIVMEKGVTAHSPLFLVKWVKSTERTGIAAVVPQKVSKKAVDRNALRRRMYDAVSSLYSEISLPVHIIIFAKHTTSEASLKDMTLAMRSVFVKAGILK